MYNEKAIAYGTCCYKVVTHQSIGQAHCGLANKLSLAHRKSRYYKQSEA